MTLKKLLIINVDGDGDDDDNIGGDWIVLFTEINNFKESVDY